MSHLIGQYPQLGWAVAKTLLLFAVAVIGLRLAERRTLTQFNVFDLVVSIAAGAIVGRTATSSTTSFATGAAALITMLLAHRLVAVLCLRGLLGRLLDRPPLVLLARSRPRPEALKSAGLTDRDLSWPPPLRPRRTAPAGGCWAGARSSACRRG